MSFQASVTLLSILADISNVVVLMVSNRPVISKSFSPFINPSVTPSRTIYNLYHRHFHVPYFFSSLAMSSYLFLFSLFHVSIHYSDGSIFFLLIVTRSLVFWSS